MYEVGRGGFGKCYLGKVCNEKQEDFKPDLKCSIEDILGDKSIVVVKKIDKNEVNRDLYSK